MTQITVESSTELAAALASATGGETILLAPGNYGDLVGKLLNYTEEVTITSADHDNPAIFDTLYLWQSSYITFDNIIVDMPVDENTIELDEAVWFTQSSHITLKNSYIEGGDSVAGIDPDSPSGTQGWEGILGYPIGYGINISRSDNIIIDNNEITNFNQGIIIGSTDNITISDNHAYDLRSTPVFGANVNNVLVEGNHFEEINSWKLGSTGDHSDFVAFATTATQTEDSDNIVIRDNFFEQGDGDAIMGIYLTTFEDSDINFTNVVIDNNVIHTSESTAMRLGTVDGLTITNNTLLPLNDDPYDTPGIVLIRGTQNVTIEGNVLNDISGKAWDDADARNITLGDNLFIQAFDPTLENYVGEMFLDVFAVDGQLENLRIIPGSEAEGYGSTLSVFDITPDQIDGYIADTRGIGADLQQHTFDVQAFLGGAGEIDLSGATVTWDFGDGTTATGETVTHDFETAGTWQVTATITLQDGASIVLGKAVPVLDLNAVTADFEGGIEDISDYVNLVDLDGNVSLVDTEHGQSLSLNTTDSRIAFEQSSELINNSEFTISFALQKDAASLDDSGFALYYAGTAVIKVFPDRVQLVGTTDEGEKIVLDASDVGIDDTDWHQITYTFSQDDGMAKLFVDGEKVDEVGGFTGSQHVTNGHDLSIGGRIGASLVANYDEVSFLRTALSEQEVAQKYADFSGTEAPVIVSAPPPVEEPVDEVVDEIIEPPVIEEPVLEDPVVLEDLAEDPPAPAPVPQLVEDPEPEPEPEPEPALEPEPETEAPIVDGWFEDEPIVEEEVDEEEEQSGFTKLLNIILGIFGLGGGSEERSPAAPKAFSDDGDHPLIADIVPIVEASETTDNTEEEEEDDFPESFAA